LVYKHRQLVDDVIKEDVEWVLVRQRSRGAWLRWLPGTIVLREYQKHAS